MPPAQHPERPRKPEAREMTEVAVRCSGCGLSGAAPFGFVLQSVRFLTLVFVTSDEPDETLFLAPRHRVLPCSVLPHARLSAGRLDYRHIHCT